MYGVLDDTRLADIATAIREKTGVEKTYKTAEMPVGIDAVYTAGKTKERSDFWDAFQQNGARTNYNYAFGGEGWNDETFKPKYDIVPTANPGSMFYMAAITDLEAALEKAGVIMDLSRNSNFPNTFYNASFTVIPMVDFSGAANTASPFTLTFMNNSELVTVRKIKLPSNGEQKFDRTFDGCSKLNSIEFEGVIGRSISFSSSPLSLASLKNIITHLKDYSETTSEHVYTITLKSSVFESLEAEKATSPNGNTWAEYIDDLKWNLVKA